MCDWEQVTLGMLQSQGHALIQTGPFGSQLHSYDYVETGVPVVPTSAIGRRILAVDGIPEISREKAAELKRHLLRAGDILFARRGVQATGLSALVTYHQADWICGTGVILLRVNAEVLDPEFVSFYLASDAVLDWLQFHAVGTTMPNLNESVLRQLVLPIPPLEEQRAIAHILGSLDDKIEANRRQNETLEAIARAIFKSWFVDFDPVHYKSRGEHPPGMDADTAALFPDSFEESELGPIPSGWRVAQLDEIAQYLNGLALQKYPAEDDVDFLPVIKIRELRQGSVDSSSNTASTEIPDAYVVRDGDVLFSWSGSLLVDLWTGGDGALNQHLFKVTSDRFSRWFYYFWTLFYLEEFRQIAADKATTMGHIKRHHLSDSLVIVPDDNLLEAMTDCMEPYLEAIVNNRIQSRTLAETRDALLPKLVSGELRVGDMQ